MTFALDPSNIAAIAERIATALPAQERKGGI